MYILKSLIDKRDSKYLNASILGFDKRWILSEDFYGIIIAFILNSPKCEVYSSHKIKCLFIYTQPFEPQNTS